MRWVSLLRRRKREQELDEEIRTHLEIEIRQRIERGESAADARANASKDFGSVALVKEITRDVWGRPRLHETWKEYIYALRLLKRHWKLAVIATASLSIAMALGILLVAIANTLIIAPPTAVDPDRLVTILSRAPGEDVEEVSYPDYLYYRANNHVFVDIAARPITVGFATDFDEIHLTNVALTSISDNYFDVLGMHPFLGRFFSPGDDTATDKIAVMTYAYWKRQGSDPNIVGKKVIGNTIIGVAPKEFTGSLYGFEADLLTPLAGIDFGRDSWRQQRDARRLSLIGRLRPGVTRRLAQAEMAALSAQLASAYPKEDKQRTAILTRATLLPPHAMNTAQLVFSILLAAVLLVLLIACANVANLLLAVAVGRRQESAIKLAVGATRGRLVREFLKVSHIVCAVGAASGYFIAWTLAKKFSELSLDLPGLGAYVLDFRLRIDATVLALAAGLMLFAMLVTGIAPAVYASSANLAGVLSGEIVAGGKHRRGRRHGLVIAQVAVCTLVLVGLGLCERSLYNLRHIDTGFSARNLISAAIYPRDPKTSSERMKEFDALVGDAVSRLPGIESVSISRDTLLAADDVDAQVPATDNKISVRRVIADGNYFSTLGLRVLSGRAFDSRDRENTEPVVIINHKLAESLWPHRNAVGSVLVAGDPLRRTTVAGVVADSKTGDLDEPVLPVIYFPLSQNHPPRVNVIARTSGDPKFSIAPIQQTLRALGLYGGLRPVTLNQWIDFDLFTKRIAADCAGVVSTLGLALAMVGLFGAVSYAVSERRREFGIRAALGARHWTLLKLIFRETLLTTGLGIAAGILLGIAATVLLRWQLYGIRPIEWSVLVPVAILMLGLSLLVAYVSARPSVTADPMEGLRHA